MQKIEIKWFGPYTIDEIEKYSQETDYGLYQIYGTHPVNGSDNLLYIGKAEQQRFSKRIKQHKWIEYESVNPQIYIGKLGGTEQISMKKWDEAIDVAERLLIYYCSPSYNTTSLNSYGNDITDTLVLNFGKKHRLPTEVSTYWSVSPYWDKDKWKVYTEK